MYVGDMRLRKYRRLKRKNNLRGENEQRRSFLAVPFFSLPKQRARQELGSEREMAMEGLGSFGN